MSEKIKVTAYSGFRAEEKPREFFLFDKKIEVVEILAMWIEEDVKHGTQKRFFKIKGSDGNVHRIYYDEKLAEWYYA